MRQPHDVFHLAIPARDLDDSARFYVDGLGCRLARRYADRITLDFFGNQVVAHLSDRWDREVTDLYPRHFGTTFARREDFDALLRLADERDLTRFADVTTRFPGLPEQHLTVVLQDPANNLVEFKHYDDPSMMY